MGVAAGLVATALALAAPPAHTSERAVALLSDRLVQYGQHGDILRRLHTGLRRDHVMNFAFNADRSRLYVLSSCLYGRDGLRRVFLSGGPSRLV
jgi:hypothetical protein